MTPYYVVVQMESSGDGTRYRLYVGRLCLSSPGIRHDTRNSSHTLAGPGPNICTQVEDKITLLSPSLFYLLTRLANICEPVIWQTGPRKAAEILKYYILPPSSYAPRDFVCMSSRAFTLFDDCPEALFESAGYVRYLKFNFVSRRANCDSLCLFPDLISMKSKALYSYFSYILL